MSHAFEGRRVAFGDPGHPCRAGEMVLIPLRTVFDGNGVSRLALMYARILHDAEEHLGAENVRYEVHMIQDGPHLLGFFWYKHNDFVHSQGWEEISPQSLEEIWERPIVGGHTFLAGRHFTAAIKS